MMNGPHPSAAGLDWFEGITCAYARYLAAVLGLRPNLFVRQGNLFSWLEEDPPLPSGRKLASSHNKLQQQLLPAAAIRPAANRCRGRAVLNRETRAAQHGAQERIFEPLAGRSGRL